MYPYSPYAFRRFSRPLAIFSRLKISPSLSGNMERSAAVLLIAFIDRHCDVDRLARSGLYQGNMSSFVTGIVNHRRRIAHCCLEISAVLILRAHSFGIFFQLGRVVRLGKKVLEEDR